MNRRDKQEIIWMKTWSAGRNWDTDAGRYTESKNRMWLRTVKEWEWSDEATVIYCNKRVRLNILHQQHFYCSWLNILSSFISSSRNWCFSDSCYKLIKEHLQRDKTLKCKRRPPLCSSASRPPPHRELPWRLQQRSFHLYSHEWISYTTCGWFWSPPWNAPYLSPFRRGGERTKHLFDDSNVVVFWRWGSQLAVRFHYL